MIVRSFIWMQSIEDETSASKSAGVAPVATSSSHSAPVGGHHHAPVATSSSHSVPVAGHHHTPSEFSNQTSTKVSTGSILMWDWRAQEDRSQEYRDADQVESIALFLLSLITATLISLSSTWEENEAVFQLDVDTTEMTRLGANRSYPCRIIWWGEFGTLVIPGRFSFPGRTVRLVFSMKKTMH